MKKLFDQLFKKRTTTQSAHVIEEIAPNVIEKKIIPAEVPKFINMDMSKLQERNRATDQYVKPRLTPRIETKHKDPPLIVKINIKDFQHPDLHFLGKSKLDGFPIFRYIGDNPKMLMQFPYEEISELSTNRY